MPHGLNYMYHVKKLNENGPIETINVKLPEGSRIGEWEKQVKGIERYKSLAM